MRLGFRYPRMDLCCLVGQVDGLKFNLCAAACGGCYGFLDWISSFRLWIKYCRIICIMNAWMWNGRILYFVALNIAMNLSDHLCSAEASTNGEFHLHNAKRKQYSSILHSLSHKLWNCNILNIPSIKIQFKNPSIHVTSGRNQRLNFERYAPYNRRIARHWEWLNFVVTSFIDTHTITVSSIT